MRFSTQVDLSAMPVSKMSNQVVLVRGNLPSLPKSQKSNNGSIYPTPPNSPSRTKPARPETLKESEDEPCSSQDTTPLRLNTPPSEAESSEDECRLRASILKERLGLSQGQCGAPTDGGTPCKKPISKTAMVRVNSQIASMIHLVEYSPELEIELGTLAKFVLCHYHDHGEKKEFRIEEWRKVFREGDDYALLPVEKRIRKVLGPLRVKCIATLRRGQLCSERIGGQKVQNCERSINEIVKLEVYSNDEHLEGFLRVLETNMYCHSHMGVRTLEKTALWKSQIREIASLDDQEPPTAENLKPVTLDFSRGFANFWPTVFDTSPFEFIYRWDSCASPADPKSSYQQVQLLLKSQLKPQEKKDGYVYLYEVQGNKGFVKLGFTTRSIEDRHKEWTFDCNRKAKNLYPIPSGSAVKIPNAQRVEALCHAELEYCKTRIYCRGCLKQHIEWFKISPEKAISVIKRWSKWIQTDPYQPRELRKGVTWNLKEEERRRVNRIETFMSETSIVTTSGLEQTPSS